MKNKRTAKSEVLHSTFVCSNVLTSNKFSLSFAYPFRLSEVRIGLQPMKTADHGSGFMGKIKGR